MNKPLARYNHFISVLGYFPRRYTNENKNPSNIAGICFMYRVAKKKKEVFQVSLCDEDWNPIDNPTFDEMDHAIVISELFLGVKQAQWIPLVHDPKLGKCDDQIVETMHRNARHDFLSKLENAKNGRSLTDYWQRYSDDWLVVR
jgi:hypothetical protein